MLNTSRTNEQTVASKKAVIIAAVVVIVLSWIVLDALLYSRVRRFKMLLSDDNPRSRVLQAVGEPDEIIEPGGLLPAWGGFEKKRLRRETWVYFVFPRHRNRFLLTFEGDALENVEHQRREGD